MVQVNGEIVQLLLKTSLCLLHLLESNRLLFQTLVGQLQVLLQFLLCLLQAFDCSDVILKLFFALRQLQIQTCSQESAESEPARRGNADKKSHVLPEPVQLTAVSPDSCGPPRPPPVAPAERLSPPPAGEYDCSGLASDGSPLVEAPT